MPARSTAEMWTKASGWPSSRLMKPKPFIALKNLTVPEAFSPVSWRCGPPPRSPKPPPRAAAIVARRPLRNRQRIAIDLEVGRRNPAAAIDEGEFERLAFGEAGEARLLDRRDVDEHVLAAIVADDEAEALLAVEEFDDAFAFADDLRGHSAAAARSAAAEAAATTAATAAAITAAATAAAIAITAATAAAAAIRRAIAAAEAAPIATVTAAIALFAETFALVSAAPAALSATPSVETHELNTFPRPHPC